MKKFLCAVAAVLCICLCLTACSTSMAYTFTIETGDSVKVQLTTGDGYRLTQSDGNFYVSREGSTVLTGCFILGEAFPAYEEAVARDAEILETGDDFYFYTIEGQAGREHNFLMLLPDSDTALLIASLSGEEEARAAFDRLTFEVNG